MVTDLHQEESPRGNLMLRDILIGMSDGLTIPFALSAALSAVVHSNRVILIAGFAVICAGAVTMAFGGYRARRSEINEFNNEHPNSARRSALYIGAAYIIGGFVPLSPYLFIEIPVDALKISGIITLICLFIVGFFKSRFTAMNPWAGALRVTLVAALAAAAAFGVAKIFEVNA